MVLIVGLLTHLVATHIFNLGHLSFLNIGDRLGATFFVVIDVSLLAAAIFHGLNGARMVVLDYWLEDARQPPRADDRALGVRLGHVRLRHVGPVALDLPVRGRR